MKVTNAFTITGFVITEGNYEKYKVGEIRPGNFLYRPEDFRPPIIWYVRHNLAIDPLAKKEASKAKTDDPLIAVPIPAKKRGRPAGTGKRSVNLHLRVQPEFMQLIEMLQQSGSRVYANKSVSDILHLLLKDTCNKHRVFGDIHNEDFLSTLHRLQH